MDGIVLVKLMKNGSVPRSLILENQLKENHWGFLMKASNMGVLTSKHVETQVQQTGQLTVLGKGAQR